MSTDEPLPSSSRDLLLVQNHTRRLSDVLQTFANENIDVRRSSYDPVSQEAIVKLAQNLLAIEYNENLKGSRTKKTERVIRELEPFLHRKYKLLEGRVRQWKKQRKPLMENLEKYTSNLNRNCKLCSSVRLLASTVEISGSIGGLLLDSESDLAKYAFGASSACGLFGFLSTFMEMGYAKKALNEISEGRKEDYKLLAEVVKWFEENRELDWVVQDLFPHGIDLDIAMQIQDDSNELEEYMKVFQTALRSNVMRDNELLKDKDFLYSVKLFSNSDAARLWFNRAIFRKHSFHLDYNRMMLQMEYGQYLVFQYVPFLPMEQQRLLSLPVAGRIALNLLTFYDSVSDLKAGAKSKYSNKLAKLLQDMKQEEEIIDDALRKMKPRSDLAEFRRSI